ncbi:hypothetical protein Ae201684P_019348 [Aphanomyces euteiches]|nr:hypothetical protein Ae201684P_019348 [Aphanomyces euteiches]
MALSMSHMGSYCCVCSDKQPVSHPGMSTLAVDSPQRIKLVASAHTFDETLPKEFEFTGVLSSGFTPRDVFDQVSGPVQNVVLNGYNASMVCYGSSGFKRAVTLGTPSSPQLVRDSISTFEDALAAYGQIGGILFRIFDQKHAAPLQIGLSVWVVQGPKSVRDLLRPQSAVPVSNDAPFQFTTMAVENFKQALSLLASVPSIESMAHVFVRVALYSPENNHQLSLLHFVDLGTLQAEEEHEFLGLFDALVSDNDNDNDEKDEPPPATSVLAQFLAPLLAGNSKTYLLGFVDAQVSVSTLDMLWVMSGVRLISCACIKLQGIGPELLDFQPYNASSPKPTLTQKLFGARLSRRQSSVVPKLFQSNDPPIAQAPSIQLPAFQSAAEKPPPPPIPALSIPLKDESWKEVVKRANLPCLAPPAPNVDGLDAQSAWTIQFTEAQLLRKHYDDLLHVLRDQYDHTKQLERQVEEFQLSRDEIDATYQVQMHDLKLANVDLRSKLRVLESETGMQTVLDKYEAEMQALTMDLDKLRSHNVNLELKLASNANIDLRNRYREIVRENVHLHEQVVALRKKERHFLASKKLMDDSAKKIDALSKLVTTKDDMLLEARLGEARLSAQVDQQQQKALTLQQQQAALAQENEKAAEELVAVKMYLASIQTEQKKAEMLDRFVKKHGASLLSTDKQKASIDEHAKKVLGAIKRAVPQVVPSVHKLIQRLHEQETSLLEYSTREMDLINLLVELATDQQALTLAQVQASTKKN